MKKEFIVIALLFVGVFAQAQDSVTVTFRYNASSSNQLFLVGEFNGWNNSATPMQFVGSDTWAKDFTLPIGGNPTPPAVGVPGAWQYKFYYNGVGSWPNDPLNHHENSQDNNNTFLFTKDPTILHFLPNQRQPLVTTNFPTITSYIFPKNGATIDTSTIALKIDGVSISNIGKFYDASTKQLVYPVATSLTNGTHNVVLTVGSSAGGVNSDSVNFTIQAGFIQITTQGNYSTRNQIRTLRGLVQKTTITSAKVIRNNVDTTNVVVTGGLFTATDSLTEGVNTFKAIVDTNGTIVSSEPVTFTYIVNHSPFAKAAVSLASGDQISLSAAGSIHPDGKLMTYKWLNDPQTPLGLTGKTGEIVAITKPTKPGEYYFSLIATDSIGAADTARFYFIIKKDGGYENPTLASNPQWAKQARVYFLFPKAFTTQGTIPAATARLQYIKDLGFSVIWMMPVMKNAYPIDQHYGPGYNITDFYNVAPEYGTNQDFKNFISQAHGLGIKVILDVTPNHTSRFHAWSQDAHKFKQDSRYWNWYEHTSIAHNANGLGQSLDADGFNYYSGFSEQLLNVNWKDVDFQTEMINAYKYWVKEFDLDGYRFDVYWGPHRRYGEQYMGKPVRDALKHIKPDIFLLAEDDGTGGGTEVIYADQNGGVDAAYDFKLYFNQIRNFYSASLIDNLHNEINNAGYYPGSNSLYMRFMESQDEDCITYFYSNSNSLDAVSTFNRTKPMATTIFTVPGFPMIWNGQEVGWGYGISGAKEARNRSTISWDFQGGPILIPHYQRLAWIRGTFPAFTTQVFDRITTGNSSVYGVVRKYENENGVSLSNFGSTSATVTIALTNTGASQNILLNNPQDGKPYFASDVYNDTTYQIAFYSGTANVSLTIPAFGSAVLIVSDSLRTITVPKITSVKQSTESTIPENYSLLQNYPNPFNPTTTINYQLPQDGLVRLNVYDMLGREIATLANERRSAGSYSAVWNASGFASGVYFYKLTVGNYSNIKRMTLLK